MKVYFDTSVLVPALVDQLSNHPSAFSAFQNYISDGNKGFCSTHSLSELYSVLTALPLPRRIATLEAQMLITESILPRLEVVDLTRNDYLSALNLAASNGLSSGIIYDALHVTAARKAGCPRIYTYNIDHFNALLSGEIEVTSP